MSRKDRSFTKVWNVGADRGTIKEYARWARLELIRRVSRRMLILGIAEDGTVGASSINLTDTEQAWRADLIEQVKAKGFVTVTEEVCYVWFVRFIVLRYMEINGQLPGSLRVYTDENGNFHPEILSETAETVSFWTKKPALTGLDAEKTVELRQAENSEELFKHLFITLCDSLPKTIGPIAGYARLLFPDNLQQKNSVIERLVSMIPEKDWEERAEILGWLHQYYIAEKREEIIEALQKEEWESKEIMARQTQIFTPDWIIQYMVENSLGRLWVEGHPEARDLFIPTKEELKAYTDSGKRDTGGKWMYYIEEVKQDEAVERQLVEIRKEYAKLTPEEILTLDPCMGSAHIIVYQFIVLFQIYRSCGYTAEDAVRNIVEKNVWGLDIEDRAGQMAYYNVMMTARKFDKHVLVGCLRNDENASREVSV